MRLTTIAGKPKLAPDTAQNALSNEGLLPREHDSAGSDSARSTPAIADSGFPLQPRRVQAAAVGSSPPSLATPARHHSGSSRSRPVAHAFPDNEPEEDPTSPVLP